jgi:hypothetical protein
MSYPFGFELNGLAVLTVSVPETSLFNATVVLYTIPIGEFITNIVKSRLSFRS